MRLTLPTGLGLGFLTLGLAYILWKAFTLTDQPIDFKYLWLAGYLWDEGINPYGPQYYEISQTIFTTGTVPEIWVYPPHFWWLMAPHALLPFEVATLVWRGFGVLMVLLAGWGFWTATRHVYPGVPPARGMAMVALLTLSSATAGCLAIGQTSLVILAGAGLYAYAYASGSRLLMMLALAILMLKPNIGLAFSLFLFVQRPWTLTVIGGGILTLALSAPALMIGGPVETILQWFARLGEWGQFDANEADATTGLRHLIWLGTGISIPPLVFAAISGGVAIWLGLRRTESGPEDRLLSVAMLLALVQMMIPLHGYDAMLLIPLALLTVGL
ncbi:MAG: glycosyltransferase family 87 protein, partial [Pseudomonadota bacterium]